MDQATPQSVSPRTHWHWVILGCLVCCVGAFVWGALVYPQSIGFRCFTGLMHAIFLSPLIAAPTLLVQRGILRILHKQRRWTPTPWCSAWLSVAPAIILFALLWINAAWEASQTGVFHRLVIKPIPESVHIVHARCMCGPAYELWAVVFTANKQDFETIQMHLAPNSPPEKADTKRWQSILESMVGLAPDFSGDWEEFARHDGSRSVKILRSKSTQLTLVCVQRG